MIRREHGLTLIELLIIVAIIGILAGIAVPNFIKIRDRERAKVDPASVPSPQANAKAWVTRAGFMLDANTKVECADRYQRDGNRLCTVYLPSKIVGLSCETNLNGLCTPTGTVER